MKYKLTKREKFLIEEIRKAVREELRTAVYITPAPPISTPTTEPHPYWYTTC